MVKCEDN